MLQSLQSGDLVLLVPGVIIVIVQLKKDKKERSTPMLVFGFALAFLGVALGFGMGGGSVTDMLAESFSDS